MTEEFYVLLEDSDGTCYGTYYPHSDEPIYFDDLDEARMYAKSRLEALDCVTVASVVETSGRRRVMDYFVRGVV